MSKFKEWLTCFEEWDTDVYAYFGPIEHQGYDQLSNSIPKKKRPNALLILGTWGGSPDAGFRIARAMQHHYEKNFSVLVPYFCKSAGTLICIGASKLILADKSELGPLDVQLRKQDEMFQQNSGLDIVRGITAITEDALDKFRDYLLEINGGSGMSTRTAADVATKLVVGLYEPIFAQVDPLKLGETSAALAIAANYGQRLNKKSNILSADALPKLIHGYPSHGFVIDRSEAKELFSNIETPEGQMQEIGESAQKLLWQNNGFTLNVLYLNATFEQFSAQETTQPDSGDSPLASPTNEGSSHENEATEADREAGAQVDDKGSEDLKPVTRDTSRDAEASAELHDRPARSRRRSSSTSDISP